MSRLYVWLNSDTRQTQLTSRANEKLDIQVNYGSRYDSKDLLKILVDYPRNPASKPKVSVWLEGKRIDNTKP